MRALAARWLARTFIGLFVLAGIPSPAAPAGDAGTGLAARETQECTRNLKQIYAAIQAYQAKYHDLPNWLSDLVPEFLPDANVLVCPVCRRTGQTEAPPLADPKLPCSYLFEFCPVSLGGDLSHHTRREWKRRQMGLLGSVVPLVRCRHHNAALNLAFDGTVFESPAFWELAFTNRVSATELTAARLFADKRGAVTEAAPALHFAPRDSAIPQVALDLTSFYNAMLTQTWHGHGPDIGNNLAELPTGLQTFGGTKFDVRGIVQLRSKSPSSAEFPPEIKGIQVHQKCLRLHFLHAAAFGKVPDEGEQLGAFVIHFATNQMRLEIPIVYGQDVRDWHTMADEPAPGERLHVAWTGQNAVSQKAGEHIRLFLTTWANPVPAFEIDSIDYVSSMANPAPFLIAITADPP